MKFRSFDTFFPPPAFLCMPSVGLDISDKSVRFLGFKNVGRELRIGSFAEEKIPPGIVVSGNIKDEKRMREVLRAFKKKHNLSFIRASLPEEQGYLFTLTLPGLKRKEIRESVELQFEEHVPLKPNDSVFDYEILTESSSVHEVQVSTVPKSVVESYTDLFIGSGLLPLSFEIEAQAIARAVIPEGDQGTHMVVDFGQSRTGISIVSRGVVVFTSTIAVGGALLTEAISKEMKISIEEAESEKRENGLFRENGKKEVFSAIMNPIATLRDELNKHYIYWHTHREGESKDKRPIEDIILCGGESNLKGFSDYLARSLRLKVSLANVWVNVSHFGDYVPEIPFGDSLTYATAIGLALGDFCHD